MNVFPSEAAVSAADGTASPSVSAITPSEGAASPSDGAADGFLGKGIIDDLPQRKILLTKGANGLGFNIRGGIDAPYVKLEKGDTVRVRLSG